MRAKNNNDGMVPVTIRLPAQLIEELEEKADTSGTTVSAVARDLLQQAEGKGNLEQDLKEMRRQRDRLQIENGTLKKDLNEERNKTVEVRCTMCKGKYKMGWPQMEYLVKKMDLICRTCQLKQARWKGLQRF